MSKGAELIAAERQRQIEQEGFDAKHDFREELSDMVKAANYYAEAATFARDYDCGERQIELMKDGMGFNCKWPFGWDKQWCKPSADPIRNLVKAGALIAACIDKIQHEKDFEQYTKSKGGEYCVWNHRDNEYPFSGTLEECQAYMRVHFPSGMDACILP